MATKRNVSMRFARGALAVAIGLVAALSGAAQEDMPAAPGVDEGAITVPRYVPEVHSFSGSPLLVQIGIPDPHTQITSVSIDAPSSQTTYQLPFVEGRTLVGLNVSPFLEPGMYELQIIKHIGVGFEQHVVHTPLQIGFLDFVFGRDNMRFGNNNDYESRIGTFGEILADWLEERFEAVEPEQLVPLVDFMYQFFGARSGRCYAFSGTMARFWRWPDQLPSYYDETYDMRRTSGRVQREMNFLQLDMVYDYFLANGNDHGVINVTDAETPPTMGRQEAQAIVEQVIAGIESGVPVVVGLLGPNFHHSMLAYGYIRNPRNQVIDLLVANNWKSDQKTNIRSSDAEYVRLHLSDEHEGRILEWWHSGGKRNNDIDQVFVVPVREAYQHDPVHLHRIIDQRTSYLQTAGRGILMVEDAKGAALIDGEDMTGYIRSRTRTEIDDVVMDRVSRGHRFEFPADREFQLEIADDAGARVLLYLPDTQGDKGWIVETEEPDEDDTVFRRAAIGPNGIVWVMPEDLEASEGPEAPNVSEEESQTE